MRMVFLTGWKNESGIIQACPMDFNDEIYDGNPFNDIHTLDGTWRDYVGVAFEEQGEPEEDMELIQERPTAKSRKVDPVSLVTAEDGNIWVGPIVGLSHTTKQQMVHGFLTAHYRKACRNPSTAVPFKRLGQHQHEMIAARHLPPQFTFTVDPSHMHVAAVVELLNFWRTRQESHPEDVFTFQEWLDNSGDLQDPITRNERPLLVARSRSRSRTPGRPSSRPKVPAQRVTSRHGKGKSRASERASTEPSNIGMDYSDMETFDEYEAHNPEVFGDVMTQTSSGPTPTGSMAVPSSSNPRKRISRPSKLPAGTEMPSISPPPDSAESSQQMASRNSIRSKTPMPRFEDARQVSDDHMDSTPGYTEGNGHQRDSSEELPALHTPSIKKRSKVRPRIIRATGQLRGVSEHDGDGADAVPLVEDRTTGPPGTNKQHTGKNLKSALKRTHQVGLGSHDEAEDAVERPQKSPRPRKPPPKPDAGVPSPPPRSYVKRKSNSTKVPKTRRKKRG
ncbi:hypothetical protein EDD15DRAFT_2362917 [Pisolithus albus]|nr:hypothetical protein EDD15DRAFT_2362917 [Pisolithus albus]